MTKQHGQLGGQDGQKAYEPRWQREHRILILCEGTRTEANYFDALRRFYNIEGAKVISLRRGERGLSGISRRLTREIGKTSGYDAIYCVVDHDGRDRGLREFRSHLATLEKSRKSPHIEIILSVPCFEYWLLLHYEFTDRPFVATQGGLSACDQVIRLLRRHVPDYKKNDQRIFDRYRNLMDTALTNAGKLQPTSSSRTDVGRLIVYLLRPIDSHA